jgi:hypothetical protein
MVLLARWHRPAEAAVILLVGDGSGFVLAAMLLAEQVRHGPPSRLGRFPRGMPTQSGNLQSSRIDRLGAIPDKVFQHHDLRCRHDSWHVRCIRGSAMTTAGLRQAV